MAAVWREPDKSVGGLSRILFLDRDGVLMRDGDYVQDPNLVELLPGVTEALRRARDAGFLLIGLSNQSGIGRGYFGVAELDAVMKRLDEELAARGVALDAFYYCPHAPGDGCCCRKPLPGLLEEAGCRFEWDPDRSWVVGDKGSDVELGRRAGLGAWLVRTGYGAGQEEEVRRRYADDPCVRVADDLADAVDGILGEGSQSRGRP